MKREVVSLLWCVFVGGMGALAAISPKAFPKMTNAYYARIGFKTRIALEDYDRISVRVGMRIVGLAMIGIACYVLVTRF